MNYFSCCYVTVIVECRKEKTREIKQLKCFSCGKIKAEFKKSPCTQPPEWQGGGSTISKWNGHYPALISYDSRSWRKTIHLTENAGEEWCRHTRFKPRAENYRRIGGWRKVGGGVFQCLDSLRPNRLAGKNTGVVCNFLLQGIFPTRVLNPHLMRFLHWQMGFSTTGKPKNKLRMF